MVMAETSVHRLYNRQEGFMQPTLVENQNLLDYNFSADGIKTETKRSLCVGCNHDIQDQYILRVAPDLEWHAACLRCQECQQFLDESNTCFVRNGKTYCKQDYSRLFGAKCDRCGDSFAKNDFVMRAKTKIFHVECFKCTACERPLNPGDEFALRDGGSLFCKSDHERMERIKLEEKSSCQLMALNNNQNMHPQLAQKLDLSNIKKRAASSDFGSISDTDSESDSYKSNIRVKSSHVINGKPARVRTVLSEKQLSMLRGCYNMNSRPDALVKEQLVEMTGLSARVIRVWFQNKRCKDKKKTIEIKLQQQQEKEGKVSYMQGVLLHASPPIRHEPHMNHQGYEVKKYQPPWKSFSQFAIHNDSEDCSHTPGFQYLVNQLHGYDLSDDPSSAGTCAEMDWQKNRDSTDSYQESEESVNGSL